MYCSNLTQLTARFEFDQHMQMRSDLQTRHVDMVNVVNEQSTALSNHLGDYVEDVANMIYQHHTLIIEKLGLAISDDDQPPKAPVETYIPATHDPTGSPTIPPVSTINMKGFKDFKPLPQPLKVSWPNGHKNFRDLIYHDLADYVDEVGVTLLEALGARVTASTETPRDEEGTNRHFEFDVRWPNGKNTFWEAIGIDSDFKIDTDNDEDLEWMSKTGRHRLEGRTVTVDGNPTETWLKEEMKELKKTVEGKVETVESKVDAIEGKVESMEGKMEAMMNMMMQLLDQNEEVAKN